MSATSCAKYEQNGWIRKESKSRPNQFYYFNTKTGESRWEGETRAPDASTISKHPPAEGQRKIDDKSVKKSSPATQNASQSKEKKVSSKSREVKKSKTPAQDRLKNLMTNNNKDIAASIKEEIEAMCNEAKQAPKIKSKPSKSAQSRLDSIPKTVNSSTKTDIKLSAEKCKSSNSKQSVVKDKQNRLTAASNKQNKINKTKQSTHKTPAQQRLNDLQKTLIKEQLINKHNTDKAQRCNNAAHEASTVSISSDADSANRSNKNNSTDLTDSVSNAGLIDADVELALAQNPIIKKEKVEPIDEAEEMEWEPSMLLDASTESSVDYSSAKIFSPTDQAGQVFVVPDTNIFLSSLVCIKDILEKESNYNIKIPYMVLQELDKLKNKENDTISQMASRAIHHIYENMKEDNKRFTGQSAIDDCRHLIEIICPDDKILNCCLQLKELGCHVILLSNDKNLSVKAKVNHVNILTSRLCNEKYDNEDR